MHWPLTIIILLPSKFLVVFLPLFPYGVFQLSRGLKRMIFSPPLCMYIVTMCPSFVVYELEISREQEPV